jgi:hypothetical protein
MWKISLIKQYNLKVKYRFLASITGKNMIIGLCQV